MTGLHVLLYRIRKYRTCKETFKKFSLLAQPKYILDPKRSVGRSARWDVDTCHLSYKLTEELFELSKPKHRCSASESSYSSDGNPKRPKSVPAKMPDIDRLSKPKTTLLDEQINEEYQASLREPESKIARPTSARISYLSQPKIRKANNNLTEEETFGVKPSALYCKSECSSYVQALAYPKRLPKDFLGSRNPAWKVKRSALRATATERINKLAESKNNDVNFRDPNETQERENFYFGRNPNPFPVRKPALKAVCSRRVRKLAKPRYRPDD